MNRYRILTGIFCLLATGNVLAEEADTLKVVDVEEITVIAAPKENRKLREQPAAVTLLSQQDMQNAQVNSIKNLTSVVPNMFIPDYGSRLTSAVYIRGIGSRINTPSVGLYVDNIPYIDKSAFDFSYADVERIDVLRGPQGTLYGRNAMGGLIKVHTKSPFSYQGTDFRMGAGTYNAYNTSLTHYHRLSERFAFSTGGFYDYQGGFFRNTVRDEKADKGQSAGGRIRAIYLPSDNWKVDLNINYEYSDQGGYPYFYQGSLAPEAQSEPLKPYIGKISNNARSNYYRNLLNTGLNLEYQTQHFTLSMVTGYQFLKDCMDIDQDFTANDIYTLQQKQRSHALSEEIILKSKSGSRWQWTTGRLRLLPMAEYGSSRHFQGSRNGDAEPDVGQCHPIANTSRDGTIHEYEYPALTGHQQPDHAHRGQFQHSAAEWGTLSSIHLQRFIRAERSVVHCRVTPGL